MARRLENWIASYLEYTSSSEAPDAFHKWSSIGTIAGALRRRVCFDMGLFRWYPNFFICFVAPPGIVSKSTTADIGMSLLRAVPGVKFGPSSVTWQALVAALSDSREDYPTPSGEYMPMCALTVVASELGTLLRPGDEEIITLLTDLWDGKEVPFVKLTKKDGEETIVNPWINLIGCTTPSWIAENWSNYFTGGGFASRSLFVYAEHKRKLVAYPKKLMNARTARLKADLVADLHEIAELQGDFSITPEAERWGIEWYEKFHTSDNPLRADSRTTGYIGRVQTHLHKTAMVLSAARGNSMTLTREDLQQAEKELLAIEPNMLSVFGDMNHEKVTDQMAQVLEIIRAEAKISRTNLYRKFVTKMGFETFNQCIEGLMAAGLITQNATAEGMFLVFIGEKIVRRVVQLRG